MLVVKSMISLELFYIIQNFGTHENDQVITTTISTAGSVQQERMRQQEASNAEQSDYTVIITVVKL